MKGLIALDIDGTTAVYGHPISQEVQDFLKRLTQDQWTLIFITGRSLRSCEDIIHHLSFPFFLAVQNGAILLEMPSRKIVEKKYLDTSILPTMQQICDEEQTGFIIYSGCENNDDCFFLPSSFSNHLLEYLAARAKSFNEVWHPLQSYEHLSIEKFSSVKCIALPEHASRLAAKIEERLGLHIPLIRDPFNADYWVAQGTHPNVNKGNTLRDFAKLFGNNNFIIAAGDDSNDLPMFEAADVKVVMSTAPAEILAIADVVAPPAKDNGLIAGLSIATRFQYRKLL